VSDGHLIERLGVVVVEASQQYAVMMSMTSKLAARYAGFSGTAS
jgi:hypothetical protein